MGECVFPASGAVRRPRGLYFLPGRFFRPAAPSRVVIARGACRCAGACSRLGMTMIEVMLAVSVLSMLVVSTGGAMLALMRQNEFNQQLALVDSEAGNVLSLVHAAPFDSIGTELQANGFVDMGNDTYQKDLGVAPFFLPQGTVSVTYLGVAGGVVPDPLQLNMVVSWNRMQASPMVRTFAAVRTR